jgi:hypothetical protein
MPVASKPVATQKTAAHNRLPFHGSIERHEKIVKKYYNSNEIFSNQLS